MVHIATSYCICCFVYYSIQSGRDSSQCSMNCSCTYTVFEPVCGNDGVTYFSPCRAGCGQKEEMV